MFRFGPGLQILSGLASLFCECGLLAASCAVEEEDPERLCALSCSLMGEMDFHL